MKAEDITEFELGNYCFGEILKVNGKDYDSFSKEDILEFINDMLINDINSSNLLKETFIASLQYLQFETVETDTSQCEECGNWNYYEKYQPFKINSPNKEKI